MLSVNETNKLVIIGSGPAAWTAAIYAARAGLFPTVLAGEQGGGQLMLTTKVENYPGFPEGILGPDLMAGMRQQAEKHGVKIIDKDAVSLSVIGSQFSAVIPAKATSDVAKAGIYTNIPIDSGSAAGMTMVKPGMTEQNGKQITAKAVIIATGATANTLKLPGEDRLMGRGVGTCAVCDAPFYKGKNLVLVIGGGDSAMEEAGELSKFVNKVIILVRKDTTRASAIMENRIKSLQNVEIWYKTEAKEFLGDKRLEKVRIVRESKEEVLAADGAFYAIGHTPATAWLAGSGVELDIKGYIMTSLSGVIFPEGKLGLGIEAGMEAGLGHRSWKIQLPNPYPTSTSIPGIFAAGDCVDPRYRQAVTAAGFGAMAALDAQKWLESQN